MANNGESNAEQTTLVVYSKDKDNTSDTNGHFSVTIEPPIVNAFALACVSVELPRADTSLMLTHSTRIKLLTNLNCTGDVVKNTTYIIVYWNANKHSPDVDDVIRQINAAIVNSSSLSDAQKRIFLARSNYDYHLYLCFNSLLEASSGEYVAFGIYPAECAYATCQDGEADPITRILGLERNVDYKISDDDYIPVGPNWAYIYDDTDTQYNLQGIDLGTNWEQWGNMREVVLLLEEPAIFPTMETLMFTDKTLRKFTPIKRIPVNYGENKVSFHATSNFDVEWVHFQERVNLHKLRLRLIGFSEDAWYEMPFDHVSNLPMKFRIMSHPSQF